MSVEVDPNVIRQIVAVLPKNRTPDDRDIRLAVVDALEEAEIRDPAATVTYIARVRVELAQRSVEAGRQSRRTPGNQTGGGAPDAVAVQPSAPYRFVALNDKLSLASETVRAHGLDCPLPGGFCGRIEVEWAAETPLLIGSRRTQDGQEVDGPLRLGGNGPYVIPGASLRGMLRAACEIVGYGRLFQVNRHHRYAVRDFQHQLFVPPLRPTWASLNAGWLARVADFGAARARGESGYTITPARKYLIRIRALPPGFRAAGESDGDFHLRWLGLRLDQRHEVAGRLVARSRPRRFDFSMPATTFSPLAGAPDEVVPDPTGPIDGWFVFANRFPTVSGVTAAVLDAQDTATGTGLQKKRECVFADDPAAQPIPLTLDAFRRFELAHTKPSRNKREPDGSYAVLAPTLAAGGRIPVFYLGDLAHQDAWTFSIGLTRLFKRAHRHSVGEVLAQETAHAVGGFSTFHADMVEQLFGYVYEPSELGKDPDGSTAPRDVAHKGRVAFGFASAPAADCEETPPRPTVMMAPRASFAPFYLRGPVKDWTDDHARLAGRKRYFPRYPDRLDAAAAEIDQTLAGWTGNGNAELLSRLTFLRGRQSGAEIVFAGELRLHNVAAAEIGMLLWALTHGGDPAKPYRHMLGRAKGAGAGQVRVKTIRLRLAPNDAQAQDSLVAPEAWERAAESREGWTDGEQSLGPFLRQFAAAMRQVMPAWPRTPPIREWLGASNPRLGQQAMAAGRAKHLSLPEFRRVREQAAAAAGLPWSNDRLLAAPAVSEAEAATTE